MIKYMDVETRAARDVIQTGFLSYQVENVAAYLVKAIFCPGFRCLCGKASNGDHMVALSWPKCVFE